MRSRTGRAVVLVWALSALWPVSAAAEPGSGPRGTVDQRFTTTRPSSPTGIGYTDSFHAADDPQGNPPYMRKMIFFPPRGMRYDTTVPEQCSASDIELQFRGPDACPEGSRLGGGKTTGIFQFPVAHDFVLDRYEHTVDVMNNANEQIVLVKAEGYAVVRGRFRPDGAIEWNLPTCFPTVPPDQCLDDYIIQLGTTTFVPQYTRTSGRRVRSYATTPPKCPVRGHWRTRVQFWWADGAVDNVVTKQPCRRPRKRQRAG